MSQVLKWLLGRVWRRAEPRVSHVFGTAGRFHMNCLAQIGFTREFVHTICRSSTLDASEYIAQGLTKHITNGTNLLAPLHAEFLAPELPCRIHSAERRT